MPPTTYYSLITITTYYLPLATKVVLSTVLLRIIYRQEDASLQAALSEVRSARTSSLQPYASGLHAVLCVRPAALCAKPVTLRVQVRRAQDGLHLSRATQLVLRACIPAAPAAAAAAAAAATAAATAATAVAAAGDAGGAGGEAGGAAGGAADEDWCRLFATNAECDALNTRRLCALHGASRAYEARLL